MGVEMRMPFFLDSLTNFLSSLGMAKDKRTAAAWSFTEPSQSELEAAYRGDWMARKVVDIPADDATREWRYWYADDKDVELIEGLEADLNIQAKVAEAQKKARLYGGSALILGVDGQGDQSKELDVERVSADQLKFVHVMTRYELQAGQLDRDPMSFTFQEPEFYEVNSVPTASVAGNAAPRKLGKDGLIRIHPSRVVRFIGQPRPSAVLNNDCWGDSVLCAVRDAVLDGQSIMGSIAALVNESKIDVIKIPGLTKILGNEDNTAKLTERFSQANTYKSILNALLLDADEEWERISVNFAGLPDIAQIALLVVSGAADIPATRMLGQSPAGLSATGESDIRNYYDKIAAEQNTTLRRSLKKLDDVLLRSAGVKNPEDVYYEWAPLWQLDEEQRAKVNYQLAQTFKIDVDAGIINKEILAEARRDQIIESETYPGFKAILEDNPDLMEPEKAMVNPLTGLPMDDPNVSAQFAAQKAAQGATAKEASGPGSQPVEGRRQRQPGGSSPIKNPTGFRPRDEFKDMAPKPLYVRRPVLNGADLIKWAKSQGFKSTLPASELHVTIVYSNEPVDWMKAGEDNFYGPGEDDGKITIAPGGPRVVERFDGGATVLQISCARLSYRHCDILWRTGGSHDYSEYNPHITISYEGPDDLSTIEPYRGKIILGPEIFEAAKGYPDDEDRPQEIEAGMPEPVKVEVTNKVDAQPNITVEVPEQPRIKELRRTDGGVEVIYEDSPDEEVTEEGDE